MSDTLDIASRQCKRKTRRTPTAWPKVSNWRVDFNFSDSISNMKNLDNRQTRTQFEPTIAFEAKRHSFNALMRYWFHIPVNIQRKINIWWCGPSRTCIDGITETMFFFNYSQIFCCCLKQLSNMNELPLRLTIPLFYWKYIGRL